ncbi:MAG: hypothetical protein K9J27_10360 [Bacteroidales bacterium]|nr:hypothetical protein [Bacteroidales bacterium]MCF8334177.1 hypothetical protein [Bacteroidales bacterium]
MRGYFLALLSLLLFATCARGQVFTTPLLQNDYKQLTTNHQLNQFLDSLQKNSPIIALDTVGFSARGKPIPLIKISGDSMKNQKPKVLFFAQQHGDEPSGKEGLLLLVEDFAFGNLNYILSEIDILIIPQANPDGGDTHTRETAEGVDMNRDHLLMEAPEVRVIEDVFEKYKPEVTVDIHEYGPYGESWKEFGYRRDFDIQVGTLTNPNVSDSIINFQKKEVIPFLEQEITQQGYSFFEYTLGHFPSGERLRHSTTDINDGRQSPGITNTLSFIVEGKNGKESTHRIRERALSQYHTGKAFLNYVFRNTDTIDKLVHKHRQSLKEKQPGDSTIIRMDHFDGEKPLHFPLKSFKTGEDTVFVVENYHYKIKSLLKVETPHGYLVPKKDTALVNIVKNNHFKRDTVRKRSSRTIVGYESIEVDIVENEGLKNKKPMTIKQLMSHIKFENYYYIPVQQIRRNKIIQAFEPKAMWGIGNYDKFDALIKKGKLFPVLRVE